MTLYILDKNIVFVFIIFLLFKLQYIMLFTILIMIVKYNQSKITSYCT